MNRLAQVSLAALLVSGSFALGWVTRPGVAQRPVQAVHEPSAMDHAGPAIDSTGAKPARPPIKYVTPRREDVRDTDSTVERLRLGVPAAELYDSEARDESWAHEMEAVVAHEFSAYLEVGIPLAEHLAISCKKTTCELSFEIPPERGDSAYARAQLLGLDLAAAIVPFARTGDRDGFAIVGLYLIFDEKDRAAAAASARFLAWNRARFPGGLSTVAKELDDWEAQWQK